MAQDQVLSFFVRLFEITGKEHYLSESYLVFNSFLRLKSESKHPWVSCVDQKGHLWIEEYPMDLPAYNLNGKIFAIYGLYDFYRITDDQTCKTLLFAALTTIKDNITKFRNIGTLSNYCLKHNIQVKRYHRLHIKQLKQLFLITGDVQFKITADSFYQDSGGL